MDASRSLAAEYSDKADAYERHWSPVIQPMARPLLDRLPLATARRLLDVGAGTGAHIADLKAAAPQAVVIGTDRASGMLRVARQSGHPHLVVADAQGLGVATCSIDAVTLIFVLFHLPDPALGLHEAHRVLRPGGSVGIVTWGRDPGPPGSAIWREELDREGAAPDPRDPRVMGQELMDTPEKLRDLVEDAGFVSPIVWPQAVAHRWTLDELLAMQTGCGMPARRLPSLSPQRREACAARVRARIARLPERDLTYRAEVLLATARRAAPPSGVARSSC